MLRHVQRAVVKRSRPHGGDRFAIWIRELFLRVSARHSQISTQRRTVYIPELIFH